ncbi:MAG: hypothetical protein LBE91_05605 [Tannerella sp.]|jgi:hypothetical protein|nr:hypothetical protein [Tannerella sp.]
MKQYRFDTRISDNGIFSLPVDPALYNTDVEIIILPKKRKKMEDTDKNENNFKKWAGAFTVSSVNDEDIIYESLKEKYS